MKTGFLISDQVPKRSSTGHSISDASSLEPRSSGQVTDMAPLEIGDIIETSIGRAKVTSISGNRATLFFEHYDHSGQAGIDLDVDVSGSDVV